MDDDDEKDVCILMLTKLTIVYTTESQRIESTTMIRMMILSVDEVMKAHVEGAAGLITC